MSRRAVAAAAVCLLLVPFAAAAAPANPSPLSEGLRVTGAEKGMEVPQIFVWLLPDTLPQEGSAVMEVEILKDGVVVSQEAARVQLTPAEGRRGVEIFAFRPATRDLYAELVRRGNVRAEARIFLDGAPVEQLSLFDLTRAAEQAGPDGLQLQPLAVVEAETPDAPAWISAPNCANRDACLQQCEDDMWACSEGLPCEWCEECEQAWLDCQANCPPPCCTEPKSVTYSTTATPVSATWSGFGCYSAYYGGPGTTWNYYYVTVKYTKYKHTEACNGTVTTTVDSIWYQSGYCWEEQWWSSCMYPSVGFPVPWC